MDNVNNYNMLITNKIVYKTPNYSKLRTITFSDSNVVFAGLDTPAFFSQYLDANPQAMNKPLEKLINMKIPVSKIMDIKTCANNCRFLSIKSLIMDTVIMMSYADLLAYEQLEDGGHILVPNTYIYKYYKYLVKYIRLITIRKFYSNTLDKEFQDAAKSLWQYALNDIRKNANLLRFGLDERDPIVITYKNYLNEVHQNLFHNKSFLSTNFPILMEIADEYQRLVFFVNKSRNLFRALNESSKTKTTTIENIVIQYAEQELSRYSGSVSKSSYHSNKPNSRDSKNSIAGGAISVDIKNSKSKPIILTLEGDRDDDDINIDDDDINIDDGGNGKKSNIISKIEKLIKDEVNIYSSIPINLPKKSFSRYSTKIMKTKTKTKTMNRKTMKTNKTTKRTKIGN
jgi:hypothetical protein